MKNKSYNKTCGPSWTIKAEESTVAVTVSTEGTGTTSTASSQNLEAFLNLMPTLSATPSSRSSRISPWPAVQTSCQGHWPSRLTSQPSWLNQSVPLQSPPMLRATPRIRRRHSHSRSQLLRASHFRSMPPLSRNRRHQYRSHSC